MYVCTCVSSVCVDNVLVLDVSVVVLYVISSIHVIRLFVIFKWLYLVMILVLSQ